MSNRPTIRREVREDDGGRFYYISKGKKKSMKSDHFQRLSWFGKEEYQEVLNVIYDYVGSIKDLATRVYPDYDKEDNIIPASSEKVGQVRSIISNLISLGIVECIADDGDMEGGLYYSLTEEGMEYYIDYLVEKIPELYKDSSLKFIKMKDDHVILSLHLFMYLATLKNIDPILIPIYTQQTPPSRVTSQNPPVLARGKDIFRTYVEYDRKLNGVDDEKAGSEDYLKRLNRKIRHLVDENIIEIVRSNAESFLKLTERGYKHISPALDLMSNYVYHLGELPIIDVEKNSNGSPKRFHLTNIGIAVKKAHLKSLSKELKRCDTEESVLDPPMPIDEDVSMSPIKFEMQMKTSPSYKKVLWIKLIDAVKDQTIETWLLLTFVGMIFFAIIFLIFGIPFFTTIFIALALLVIIVTFIIMGITELKMLKME